MSWPAIAGQLATVELSDCSWVGLEPLLGLLACPGLRHLAVSGCRGPAPSGTPPQPPSRLTHLKLDDTRLSVPELQYLLQQLCPALEHLEIFSAPKAVAGALVDELNKLADVYDAEDEADKVHGLSPSSVR